MRGHIHGAEKGKNVHCAVRYPPLPPFLPAFNTSLSSASVCACACAAVGVTVCVCVTHADELYALTLTLPPPRRWPI